jgi:hypothetical protein
MHGEPVPIDLFFWRDEFVDDWSGETIQASWAWENGRKMGGDGPLDYATGIRKVMHKVTREVVYEIDGRFKVALDCRKCGLHLPMRWTDWTARLDRLADTGQTSVSLPALVAMITK